MATKVKFSRVDLAANYTSTDAVYALGEILLEQDTWKVKIGDGVTAWTSLPYRFEGTSDHLLLSNIGTNSHADIDTHIADTAIHTDNNVQVTSNDLVPGTLLDKINATSTRIGLSIVGAPGTDQTFAIDVNEGNVDHNNLQNYVASEHIDWTQSGVGTIHASNYTDNDTVYAHPDHTGEVLSTGDGAQVLDPSAIDNKVEVTAASGDQVLLSQGGVLRRTDILQFLPPGNHAVVDADNNFSAAQTINIPGAVAYIDINSGTSNALIIFRGNTNLWAAGSASAADQFVITSTNGLSASREFVIDNDNNTVDVYDKRIVDLLDPVDPQDAVTKAYGDANYLSGGSSNWNKNVNTLNTLTPGDAVRIGDATVADAGLILQIVGDSEFKGPNVYHRFMNDSTVQFSKATLEFKTFHSTAGKEADLRILCIEKDTTGSATGGSNFIMRRQNSTGTEWLDYIYIDESNNISFNNGKTAGRTYGDITFKNADVTFDQQIQVSGGSPGVGKVLTSDAVGLATWETPTGGGGSAYSLWQIWAEESGALANGTDEWSYGNGNVGAAIGVVVPVDCRVPSMTFNTSSFGTSISMDLLINTVVVQTVTFTANNTVQSFTPIALTAGDLLNFRTNTVNGTFPNGRIAATLEVPASGLPDTLYTPDGVAAITTENTTKKVTLEGYGLGNNTGTEAFGIAVDASGNIIERMIHNPDVSFVTISALTFGNGTYADVPGLSTTVSLQATGTVSGNFHFSAVRAGGSNSITNFRVVVNGDNGITYVDTVSSFNDIGSVSHHVNGLGAGTYTVKVQANNDQDILINAAELRAEAVED